ncbi:cystathionine beta-lyase [candidate division KSB3 bacterium]|uniref:cysteine-S-conjugate beta-lyase n=1 Tax=candidate division KSB3 bacterium TaxID=2044937 RepID=A0A2G6KAM0_9BACT|nr:MAG: cystathionine beta-lyase [candidate division KSB3 bacterium]
MIYDFDTIIERRNTNSYKWDTAEQRVGDKDVLPLWVADMDFQAPPAVLDTLRERVEHGILGYTMTPDSCYEAIIEWMRKRHGWNIQQEWIVFTSGVVPAFFWAVRAYTEPGDSVIVQPPVYYPFFKAVTNNGRQLIENPLRYVGGRYEIDFDKLERQFTPRTKLFLLCSPHNPVGRVWTKEELTRVAELCLKHNVLCCSDEIHADLILSDKRHIPTAMLSDEIARNTVTCSAANKTFNIAGLSTGFMIISDPERRAAFHRIKEEIGIGMSNLFGVIATEAAYRHGEEWLEQLLKYLRGNLEFLIRFFEERIPQIKVVRPEGCYLAWLDCRELRFNDDELKDFMLKEAKVWLNNGPMFGEGGSGFHRLNFACPRSTMQEGLERIEKAVKARS